jgi:hypothetical protein
MSLDQEMEHLARMKAAAQERLLDREADQRRSLRLERLMRLRVQKKVTHSRMRLLLDWIGRREKSFNPRWIVKKLILCALNVAAWLWFFLK